MSKKRIALPLLLAVALLLSACSAPSSHGTGGYQAEHDESGATAGPSSPYESGEHQTEYDEGGADSGESSLHGTWKYHAEHNGGMWKAVLTLKADGTGTYNVKMTSPDGITMGPPSENITWNSTDARLYIYAANGAPLPVLDGFSDSSVAENGAAYQLSGNTLTLTYDNEKQVVYRK